MSLYVPVAERDDRGDRSHWSEGLLYDPDPEAAAKHGGEYIEIGVPDEDAVEAEIIEAELIERELSRQRLKYFTARFTPDYVPGWHLDEISASAERIEQMIQLGYGTDARLILEAPPRHGKSQTISRCLPLWYLGRHPKHEIIVATYGQDLADDLGRWAKNCLKDPAFQAVFPDLKLRKDSQAANRLDTTKGGGIRYVGVGASLTGRGGHLILCLHGSRTLVLTQYRGLQSIANVKVGDKVLTHKRRWRRVTAVRNNGVRTTKRYGRVWCTPDHRLLRPDGVWCEAQHCREVMHADISELPNVREVVHAALTDKRVLLAEVPGRELAANTDEGVPGMRDQVHRQQSPEDVLLYGVCERGADLAEETVRPLRGYVPAEDVQAEIVLSGMPRRGQEHLGDSRVQALRKPVHCGEAQPSEQVLLDTVRWEGSGEAQPVDSAQEELCPEQNESDEGSVSAVPRVRRNGGFEDAPHRREQAQRLSEEPHCFVSCVPHKLPQDQESDEAEVYDLSVEDDHSFVCVDPDALAEDHSRGCRYSLAIVHNCDDLVKDAEAADSEAISEATWKWYTSVLRTRLAPGGGIVVMHTRWRLNDPIGRILKMGEEGGEHYERITFPAMNEDSVPNEWGMAPGETLHPKRFSRKDMLATKSALPPRDWRALYMQKPMADEGNVFKVNEFDLYPAHEVPKTGVYWGVAADLAYSTASSADHSVIWPFGVTHEDLLVFHPDFTRARMTTDQSIERILDYAHEFNAHCIVLEGGQAWRAIEPDFKRRMKKRGRYFNILTPPAVKDKYTRSRPLHARMQAGMVRWPDTTKFKHVSLPEFTMFTGKNDDEDDQVDCTSWAAHAAQGMPRPHSADAKVGAPDEDDGDLVDWSMAAVERRHDLGAEGGRRRKHSPPTLTGAPRKTGAEYRYA